MRSSATPWWRGHTSQASSLIDAHHSVDHVVEGGCIPAYCVIEPVGDDSGRVFVSGHNAKKGPLGRVINKTADV